MLNASYCTSLRKLLEHIRKRPVILKIMQCDLAPSGGTETYRHDACRAPCLIDVIFAIPDMVPDGAGLSRPGCFVMHLPTRDWVGC